MIHHHLTFNWLPLNPVANERIEGFARNWRNTRWVQGQRARKFGADCVQISMAFLDDMFRASEPTFVPSLPARIAINRPEKATPTIMAFKRSHYGLDRIEDMTIEPGDLVVLRSEVQQNAAHLEGHVVVAMPSPYTVFSITRTARAQIVTLASYTGILSVYRPREKFRWALPH